MKTLRPLTLALAIALLFITNTGKAQLVLIPDNDFATFLDTAGFSSCLQGNIATGYYLDTNCAAILSATQLNLPPGINDATGVQYFDALEFLNLSSSAGFVPLLPPNLQTLYCSGITNPLFGNQFAAAVLPESLITLECNSSEITALPQLPSNLQELSCGLNYLTALPALPAGLIFLDCYDNDLQSLPVLPNGLQGLGLNGNWNLGSLPATLPDSLRGLTCDQCGLSVLPPLPPNLVSIDCIGNQLTALPALPASLRYLHCMANPLGALPALPPQLISLMCAHNNLTSLPTLPDSLARFDISGNFLQCLPPLKKIREFYYDNLFITCLPNHPQGNVLSSPPLNTYPLCSYFNTNSCLVASNLSGRVYIDSNLNCQPDTTEPVVKNIKVLLWSGGVLQQQTTTNALGYYTFDTYSFGTYQISIDTTAMLYQVVCPAGNALTTVITAADSVNTDLNFALQCKPGFDLQAGGINASGNFRPANYTTVEVNAGLPVNFYNALCTPAVSGTVTLTFTGPAKFISPAPNALTPTVAGNTLTWNIANFANVNFFEDFDVIVQTDTSAQFNQQVCFTLNVTPTTGDNNPSNNTFTICFQVINSYDPNDKQAYPNGNIDTAQRELVYTIRFQNTGNAEAQHIYLTDTLSSYINPASFQLLAYSHQPIVQLDGNKLRFNFPYINLPDSTTNEPASHGYVQFKVKLNNGLPVGTVINNTAHIYFDFNAPVVTNTTVNTIYVPAPPVLKPTSISKYKIQRAVMPNGRL